MATKDVEVRKKWLEFICLKLDVDESVLLKGPLLGSHHFDPALILKTKKEALLSWVCA